MEQFVAGSGERQFRKDVGDSKFELFLAVALPMLFMIGLRLFTVIDAEIGMDCFYHVALADFGWDYYSAKEMPHMTMSLWTSHFSDKELLFHFLLSCIRGIGHAFGAVDFPFNIPAFFFIFLLIVTFVAVARQFHIRHVWMYSLLLTTLTPWFTGRMLMLRPHVMAVTLMILACGVFQSIRGPKTWWRAFAIGFLFAWSYSNPHFIMLPACVFALPGLMRKQTTALTPPMICLAGLFAGYIAHPQFPNTFLTWKIQCVDVPIAMMTGGSEIRIGDELLEGGFRQYANAGGLFALIVLNLCLIGILLRKYSCSRFPRCIAVLMILAFVAFSAVILNVRFLEYACPFALLATGAGISAICRYPTGFPRPVTIIFSRTCGMIIILGLLAFAGTYCLIYFLQNERIFHKVKPLEDLTEWTKKAEIPMGTVIGNVNWSDFPVLLYSAPQFRYLLGIEPMFGYAAFPEKMTRLEQFRMGKIRLTPKELKELLGASLIYVSPRNWELARDMANAGYGIIYQGTDGWVFNLDLDIKDSKQNNR